MSKQDKYISLNNIELRKVETDDATKMVLEGYPIVFNKETIIGGRACGFDNDGYIEVIDPKAFDNTDMGDVCLRYNHSDGFTILARTRNGSLTLTVDEKGVFMHAELIDTTTNKDIYKMAQAELLTQGSFAFTVDDYEEEKTASGQYKMRITSIPKLFDVSIVDYGAYGDNTEIHARSAQQAEALKLHAEAKEATRLNIMRTKNANKIKLIGVLKNE